MEAAMAHFGVENHRDGQVSVVDESTRYVFAFSGIDEQGMPLGGTLVEAIALAGPGITIELLDPHDLSLALTVRGEELIPAGDPDECPPTLRNCE
jgi:hypothetical protein